MPSLHLFIAASLFFISFYKADAQFLLKNVQQSVLMQTKFSREMVRDVKSSPSLPEKGKVWTLTELKAPFDVESQSLVDWGKSGDRYLMFSIELDNSGKVLEDDIGHTKALYVLSLKLYEHSGKLVKTVSRYGEIIGLDAERFVYIHEERKQSLFAPRMDGNENRISYSPLILRVDRFSQLLKFSVRPKQKKR